MKNYILSFLLLAATTGVAVAQSADQNMQTNAANAEARAKESTDRVNAVAQLTQDQYSKVLQVNRSFFSQMRSSGSGRGAGRLEAWREQQIKGIVGPDQFQKVQDSRVLQE